MGAAESQPVRNIDKRTARRDHAPLFAAAVEAYRGRPREEPAPPLPNRALRVCVRRRPIFAHETTAGEFDVLTADTTSSIVVHDCRLKPDCRHLFISHHKFIFDRVYSEAESGGDVYAAEVRPLVDRVVRGGHATVMMYGQTGSGKTFTMGELTQQTATDLFRSLGDGDAVTASYAQLTGGGAQDMLHGGASCQLLTDHSGVVQVVPLLEVEVISADALLALLAYAATLRATAATGVHDASSRSHAMCRVHVQRKGAAPGASGCLTLVDLAGSEQRIDSAKHDAKRAKESAAINASLMALKESVRALARGEEWTTLAGGRHPLTQLLRASFTTAGSSALVVATVSPASKDTEHSLNTLRHACVMDGRAGRGGGKADGEARNGSWIDGGDVEKEELGEIDYRGTQSRLKAEAERLARAPGDNGGGGGFGYSERDGIGGTAQAAADARRVAREEQAAFRSLERRAARQLQHASEDMHAALVGERQRAATAPSALHPAQYARLRHRVAQQQQAAQAAAAAEAAADAEAAQFFATQAVDRRRRAALALDEQRQYQERQQRQQPPQPGEERRRRPGPATAVQLAAENRQAAARRAAEAAAVAAEAAEARHVSRGGFSPPAARTLASSSSYWEEPAPAPVAPPRYGRRSTPPAEATRAAAAAADRAAYDPSRYEPSWAEGGGGGGGNGGGATHAARAEAARRRRQEADQARRAELQGRVAAREAESERQQVRFDGGGGDPLAPTAADQRRAAARARRQEAEEARRAELLSRSEARIGAARQRSGFLVGDGGGAGHDFGGGGAPDPVAPSEGDLRRQAARERRDALEASRRGVLLERAAARGGGGGGSAAAAHEAEMARLSDAIAAAPTDAARAGLQKRMAVAKAAAMKRERAERRALEEAAAVGNIIPYDPVPLAKGY